MDRTRKEDQNECRWVKMFNAANSILENPCCSLQAAMDQVAQVLINNGANECEPRRRKPGDSVDAGSNGRAQQMSSIVA